jgi:hypothetical protein
MNALEQDFLLYKNTPKKRTVNLKTKTENAQSEHWDSVDNKKIGDLKWKF